MTDVQAPPEPPIKEPEEPKVEEKKPAKSSLEDELAALLAGTADIVDGAKDASKTASRVRRKSKEINASCESMWESSTDKSGAANLWRMLGRNRRASKDDSSDLSDEALRKAFDEIDADKGGTIDKSELAAAIKKANPNATDEMVENLWKFADNDGNGEITFEEYCQIMRTM